MPSTDELQDVLRGFESPGHDLDGMLSAALSIGGRRQRRRSALRAAAVLTAATVAVGVVAVNAHKSHGTRTADVRVLPSPTVTRLVPDLLRTQVLSAPFVPTGLSASYSEVGVDSQSVALRDSHGFASAEIEAALPGSVDAGSVPATAVRVSVGPHDGYRWTTPTTDQKGTPNGSLLTVAWTARPGLQVKVTATELPREAATRSMRLLSEHEVIRVARAVRVDSGHPARTPLGMRFLPAGYRVVSVELPSGPQNTSPQNTSTIVNLAYGRSSEIGLQILTGTVIPPARRSGNKRFTAGRFHGTYNPSVVSTTATDGRQVVDVFYNAGEVGGDGLGSNLSLRDVSRIVAGLRLADSARPETWLDLRSAFGA